jgi:hypothetical protein
MAYLDRDTVGSEKGSEKSHAAFKNAAEEPFGIQRE